MTSTSSPPKRKPKTIEIIYENKNERRPVHADPAPGPTPTLVATLAEPSSSASWSTESQDEPFCFENGLLRPVSQTNTTINEFYKKENFADNVNGDFRDILTNVLIQHWSHYKKYSMSTILKGIGRG